MKSKNYLASILVASIVWTGCTLINKPTATDELFTLTSVSQNSGGGESTSSTSAPVDNGQGVLPVSTGTTTKNSIPLCPLGGSHAPASAGIGIQSTIVYQKRFYGLYTVGGDPLTNATLPVTEDKKYSTFGFSADGNWFAFSPLEYSSSGELIFESPTIILLGADGEKIEQTLSVEGFSDELQVAHKLRGFSNNSYWINNKTIYTTLYSANPDPNTTRKINHLPKVFDPFKNIWRDDLLEDIPKNARSYSKAISPDMTRILYMNGDGLFLRDLEKGVEIWHDENLFAGFGALMFWSADSETVAFANLYEPPENRTVVLISRDGIVKAIMGSSSPLPGKYLEDLRWSPDGHYIAILAWEGKDIGDSVYLYDFEKDKYVSQCPIAKGTDSYPQLLWSPDNKYVSYVSLDYPLIIMDIQTGEIFQLADEGRAVGWSEEFPVIWP